MMFTDIMSKYSLEEQAIAYAHALERRDAGAESLFRSILRACEGVMDRYTGALSKKTLEDILRGACVAYEDGSRKLSLVDTYILMIDDRIERDGCKKPNKSQNIEETIYAKAFYGNGVGGFRRRNNVGRPEELALSMCGGLTRQRQAISFDEADDEEISDLIDSILFG